MFDNGNSFTRWYCWPLSSKREEAYCLMGRSWLLQHVDKNAILQHPLIFQYFFSLLNFIIYCEKYQIFNKYARKIILDQPVPSPREIRKSALLLSCFFFVRTMYIDLTEFKQRKPTKYTHIVQGLYCFLPPKCIIILFYYQLSIHSILPILRIQLELFTLIETMFKKMQPIYQTL